MNREETLKTVIRDALRCLDRCRKAQSRLHRDIRRLLDLADSLARDSKEIWDPVTPLRGNLQAALDLLERPEEERNEESHAG